jgi:formamidopyrimidine-DNA glycosylase
LELESKLAKSTAPIKVLLLDQERLFSGIGNWVADEVLYHAGIHPLCPANTLNRLGVQALARSIELVLTTAVAVNARSEEFPADWLFHCRWNKGKKGATMLPNGKIYEKSIYCNKTVTFFMSEPSS